jgi:hypothetical protein
MAYVYEFSVSTSGTLDPDGNTISGSKYIEYTKSFTVQNTSSYYSLFQIPPSGTLASGINSCYRSPISGTGPILKDLSSCDSTIIGFYDTTINVSITGSLGFPQFLFDIPSNSFIVGLDIDIINTFSGGYSEPLVQLYPSYQSVDSNTTCINDSLVLKNDYELRNVGVYTLSNQSKITFKSLQ